MSYIRCLSNPESMYVVCCGETVDIYHGVKKPFSSGKDFRMPVKVFEGVAKQWVAGREPAFFQGAQVEEVHIDDKTGKLIPPAKPCKKGCKMETKHAWRPCVKCLNKQLQNNKRPTSFKIRLSYGFHFVNMWTVTWDYMISRFKKG